MSNSRLNLTGLSQQLPSRSGKSVAGAAVVSESAITQAAIDVMNWDEFRPFGMAEDELAAETVASLRKTGVDVTETRVRDVIEHYIADGEEFDRLLGPNGPIALNGSVSDFYDIFSGQASEALRIDQLLEQLHDENPYKSKEEQLRDITVMVELGYLKTDNKLYLTLMPNLIYMPNTTESAMEAEEDEEYYQPSTRRLSTRRLSESAEYPVSKRSRVDEPGRYLSANARHETLKTPKTPEAARNPSPYTVYLLEEIPKIKKQWLLEGRDPEI